jgi:hypothetical protein
MKKETGIESSVSEFEVKDYMQEIIFELKKNKGNTREHK